MEFGSPGGSESGSDAREEYDAGGRDVDLGCDCVTRVCSVSVVGCCAEAVAEDWCETVSVGACETESSCCD